MPLSSLGQGLNREDQGCGEVGSDLDVLNSTCGWDVRVGISPRRSGGVSVPEIQVWEL